MGLADTASLIVDLSLKGNFTSQLKGASRTLSGFDRQIQSTQGRAYKAGQQIGTGIKSGLVIAAGAVGFLATNVALGLRSLDQLETVVAQTNAVLKSTKGAAGESAKAIRDLAQKYEGLNATIDDTVIQSGANVLLTFTNIRKQAFEPALAAALDLSVAMKQDLQSSIVQVGKALNDPLVGLTALRRIGVAFSTDQVKVIKKLAETGHVEQAQTIILKELNKEFGGSFLAGGQTTAGKVAKFTDSIDDLQRALATALLPAIGKVADGLTKFLADPAVVKGVAELGQNIASLFSDKNLAQGADFLKGAFETAKEAAPVVAAAAKATFSLVQSAVGLFRSLPPELQKLAVGAFAVNKLTGGLVTNIGGAIAGGLASFLAKSFTGGMNVNAGVVNVNGGGGVPGVAGKAGGLSGLAKVALVGEAVGLVAAVVAVQQAVSAGNTAIGSGISDTVKSNIANGASVDDMKAQLAAVDKGIADIANTPLHSLVEGEALNQLKQTHFDLTRAIEQSSRIPNAIADGAKLQVVASERAEANLSSSIGAKLKSVESAFHSDIGGLRKATKPFDIAKFAKAIAKDVTGGQGNAANTDKGLAQLKTALAKTHDPKTAAILRAAIHQVQAKIPGREYIQKQIDHARKIARSTESTKQKLVELKTIENALVRKGDTHAAAQVRKLELAIVATKKVSADTRAEGIGIRNSVDRKKLNVNVYATQTVTIRDIRAAYSQSVKYGIGK